MVVVNPAYWYRSHGSDLVKWGKVLSDLENIYINKLGVAAIEVGEKLYLSLNLTKLATVELRDEEEPPNKVSIGMLRYNPQDDSST